MQSVGDGIDFGAVGGGGRWAPPPHFFGPGGKGAHHFELQPLVCIFCSGKVITLTQQCITQVTNVTTNSQQDPKMLGLVRQSLKNCHLGVISPSRAMSMLISVINNRVTKDPELHRMVN